MVRRIGVIGSLVLSLLLFALVAVSFFDPPSLVREIWPGKWLAVDVLEGRLRIRTSTVLDRTDADLRQMILVRCNPVFECWGPNACPLDVPSEGQVHEALGGNPLEPEQLPAFMKLIRTHEAAQAAQTGRFIKLQLDRSSRLDRRWWVFERKTGVARTSLGLSRVFHPFDEVVIMPLWGIASALFAWPATAALLTWLKRRKHDAGLCESCGYDLTGNVSGTCPECGQTLNSHGPRDHSRHAG